MGLWQHSPQSSLLSVCILHLFQQKYPLCCWYFQKAHDKTQCQCCQDSSVWVSSTKLITTNEFTQYLQHDCSSCRRSQQHSPATKWAGRTINPGALVIWGGNDGRDRDTNADTQSLGQVETGVAYGWDSDHSSGGNSCCSSASCAVSKATEIPSIQFPIFPLMYRALFLHANDCLRCHHIIWILLFKYIFSSGRRCTWKCQMKHCYSPRTCWGSSLKHSHPWATTAHDLPC